MESAARAAPNGAGSSADERVLLPPRADDARTSFVIRLGLLGGVQPYAFARNKQLGAAKAIARVVSDDEGNDKSGDCSRLVSPH